MSETRMFHLGDVLTITTGCLVSPRHVEGIYDIALTTNGILLEDQAQALKDAGLTRINISLDALSEETFRKIARREGYWNYSRLRSRG